MYTNVCDIIHDSQRWKKPKCPSTDAGYTRGILLSNKKNKVLTHAGTWINLEIF